MRACCDPENGRPPDFWSSAILTWRRPKRQLVDTVNYWLRRIDELTVEELEDLDGMTRGPNHTVRERAGTEERHGSSTEGQSQPKPQ